MSIDPNLTRCEEEAARLLPWYVTGNLAGGDAERVMRHLEHCAVCRADAEHERAVRAMLTSDARIEYAPQPGLAKTLERIDALAHDSSTAPPRAARQATTRWLAAAVIIQAIGLGILGAHLYQNRAVSAAGYGTLSTAQPAPSSLELRTVFAPGTTLGELKVLLAAQNLSIVRGPSDAGAYTLAAMTPGITRESLAGVITTLRRDPRVLFVEPVYDGEPAGQ